MQQYSCLFFKLQLALTRQMITKAATRLNSLAKVFLFSQATSKLSFKFEYGCHMIPHPEKVAKGGEDAIYTSSNFLVVADGVGGWADLGVDPGLYSKKLVKIIGGKVEKSLMEYVSDPRKLLSESVKENKEQGSTTVCIFALHPETGKLIVYYLGDSVYAFFAENEIQVAPDQQKSFNFPYQVGSEGDDPNDGVLHEYPASEVMGKKLLLATDGLWDNYQIEKMHDSVFASEDLSQIAKNVAQEAYKCSLMENYESPFYKKALEHRLRTYKSGKPDDISLIVAKVVSSEQQE